MKRGSALVSLCDHSALLPQANFRSLSTAIASGPRGEGAAGRGQAGALSGLPVATQNTNYFESKHFLGINMI